VSQRGWIFLESLEPGRESIVRARNQGLRTCKNKVTVRRSRLEDVQLMLEASRLEVGVERNGFRIPGEAFGDSTTRGQEVEDSAGTSGGDHSVRLEPEDQKSMERMARYILRPPLSLARMKYADGSDEVMYEHKTRNGQPGPEERFDALDFLARVISHIQEPKLHFAHDLGHYSNVSRGRRRKGKEEPLSLGVPGHALVA